MPFNTTPDSYTKLLIHSDTSDTSTTFVDSSTSGHTITTGGGMDHSTTKAKFGATSIYNDGTSDYLSISDSDDWDFGSGDFTIDFWIYPVDTGQWYEIINQGWTSGDDSFLIGIDFGSTNKLQFYYTTDGSTDIATGYTGAISTTSWTHIAVVRNSTTIKTYRNGVEEVSYSAGSDTIHNSSESLYVGLRETGGGFGAQGYIDEIRVSKGIARWTENFTPPSRPYSIIDDQFHTDIDNISDREIVVGGQIDSYTKLLIHSDDIDEGTTIVDSSPSGHTITANGDASHQGTTAKFGATSMYFDGTDDYLSYANHNDFDWGTGDFTLDFWIYHSATKTSGAIWGHRASGGDNLQLYYGWPSSGYYFLLNDTTIQLGTAYVPPVGQWQHYAIVRDGNNFTFYIDGSVHVTTTSSSSLSKTGYTSWGIGYGNHGNKFTGYIDEFRISKGIARWTDTFVPPKRMYGEKTVISAEGGVGIGTNIAREAFHVNSGQRRLYSVTADATGSLFSVNDKNGSVLLDVDNEGWVTKPKLPAFFATPSTTQDNIADGVTVAFGTEIFDQGNNFASSIFTAPVTGRYQMSFGVRADNITASGTYKRVKLVTSNRNIEMMIDPERFDQTSAYHTFTLSVLCDMDASDTAFVQWSQSGGDSTQDIDPGSWFSGYLVC